MYSHLTRRLFGRSKARQRRVSLWVLVWICLSQFPIPVAHSHDDIAHGDSRLASHIESKHSTGTDETNCLHWHLMMPWETGDHEDEKRRRIILRRSVCGVPKAMFYSNARRSSIVRCRRWIRSYLTVAIPRRR